MTKNLIPVQPNSKLIIEHAEGDLHLRGWGQQEIQVLGSSITEPAQSKDGNLRLSFAADASLKVPYDLPITIENARGDLVIQDHHQTLSIIIAAGDLVIENASQPVIKRVDGDLAASRIEGDLIVESTGGDLSAVQITGQAAVNCDGDMALNQIGRGIDARAAGNLSASFSPLPWQIYQLKAGGDISVSLPHETKINADLTSASEDIQVRMADKKEKFESAEHQFQSGADGAAIKISAGGSVNLSDEVKTHGKYHFDHLDLNNLDQVIKDFSIKTIQQIEDQLTALDRELQETLDNLSSSLESYGLNEENLTRVKKEIREAGALAASKAKATASQAEEKLQQNIRRAQKKARDFQQKNRDFNLEDFLFGSSRKSNQTQEERLLILQMLQDQKISAAEAAGLISALENEDPS
jgi:hypothetical protein